MAILTRGDEIDAEAVPVEIRIARGGGRAEEICARRASRPSASISSRRWRRAKWNVSGAARVLGMERTNLHKRIRALGLVRGQ